MHTTCLNVYDVRSYDWFRWCREMAALAYEEPTLRPDRHGHMISPVHVPKRGLRPQPYPTGFL